MIQPSGVPRGRPDSPSQTQQATNGRREGELSAVGCAREMTNPINQNHGRKYGTQSELSPVGWGGHGSSGVG